MEFLAWSRLIVPSTFPYCVLGRMRYDFTKFFWYQNHDCMYLFAKDTKIKYQPYLYFQWIFDQIEKYLFFYFRFVCGELKNNIVNCEWNRSLKQFSDSDRKKVAPSIWYQLQKMFVNSKLVLLNLPWNGIWKWCNGLDSVTLNYLFTVWKFTEISVSFAFNSLKPRCGTFEMVKISLFWRSRSHFSSISFT